MARAIIPEVIEPDETLPPDLVALRKFAYLMDEAVEVPGTGRRIGLDAGLSLIPTVGEIVGALLSTWIVIGALRHRVPILRVTRMIVYVLLDMTIGSIPILGTIFDWLFEENVINLKALLRYRDRSRPPRSFGSIAGAVIGVVAIILLFSFFLIAAFVVLVIWLIGKR